MKHKELEEIYAVLLVCQRYGYGNVMEIASALWRYDFKRKGIPTDGCFIPALKSTIMKRNKDMYEKTCRDYDSIIKKVIDDSVYHDHND